MAFQSVSDIAQSSSRRAGNGRGTGNKLIGITLSSSYGPKTKSGQERKQICFSISEDLMKQSRWIHGDRVDILIDKQERLGLIKRVQKGGYALSKRGGAKSKCSSASVKMTWYQGMPLPKRNVSLENVNVDGEGIIFSFPQDVEI